MTIAVIGPGAIGCLIAAYLAKAGANLWLLDHRPERAALLKERGIAVDGERGGIHTHIEVTADPARISSTTAIIVCVKACDTKGVAAALQGVVSPDSCILTLQNGLGNVEELSDFFGPHRVFAGVTSHGATMLDAGRVRHAGYGEIWLGQAAKASSSPAHQAKLRRVAASLNRAGLQAHVVDDIHSFVWRKLVVNVGINALTAVLGVRNGELAKIPESQEIMEMAVTEAVGVARHQGIHLRVSEEIERVRAVCESTAANISSMLQDVRRRKKTEIDQINGAIVRLAQQHGLPSLVNTVLTALVKSIEATYDKESTI